MPGITEQLNAALSDRYVLERVLGQGGMATVYLAHDVRHDRRVALKVLRPELAVVLGAERFVQEIKTTAALQHPHILGLIDSGQVEKTAFYVMPFVDGESLRQRLSREGELPIPDTLRILTQVADALAFAHHQGVVHRDIKPDNILLAGRHALVADFGVAKAVLSVTGADRLTSTGVSIGTPTYMAPEQAMADPHVDHRADIYALGILGYEMLTGTVPFQGLSAMQLMAAKATEEAPPAAARRSGIPPALNELIAKCLEQRPADRYQSVDEVLARLENLVTPGGGTGPAAGRAPIGSHRRVAAWLAGSAVLIAAVIGGVALLGRRALSLTTANAVPVTADPGMEFQPALSPDGSLVAYVAVRGGRWVVGVRSTGTVHGAEVRPAEADSGDQVFPTWSPDGEFLRFTNTLPGAPGTPFPWKEVGRLGGAAVPLALPRSTRWPAWSRDGRSFALARADSLFIYAPHDTSVQIHPERLELNSFAWSPDRRWIAYVQGNSFWPYQPNTASSSIWVVPVDGGDALQVAGGDFLNVWPVWLDARHLLFVSNRDGPRQVYAVEIGRSGPRGVIQMVPGGTDAHSISVSADGTRLAIAKLIARQNIRFYPMPASGSVSIGDGRPVTAGAQVVETHDLSPDGQWLVYSSNLRGNADLYRVRQRGGDPIPITTTPTDEFSPAWSPDGKDIAYEIAGDLWVVPVGGGQPQQLTSGPAIDLHPMWSRDGLSLGFTSRRSGRWEIWILRRDRVGGSWVEPVQFTVTGCIAPRWEPDGDGLWCQQRGDSLLLISPARLVRRRLGLEAAGFLRSQAVPGRDGSTVYVTVTTGPNPGVWLVPLARGRPRRVVRFDNEYLSYFPGGLTVAEDGVYLTTVEWESDIWIMDINRSRR